MRFVADDALEVYVTTESMYRKYRHMTENPRVALVVDGDYNLQLEGCGHTHTAGCKPLTKFATPG